MPSCYFCLSTLTEFYNFQFSAFRRPCVDCAAHVASLLHHEKSIYGSSQNIFSRKSMNGPSVISILKTNLSLSLTPIQQQFWKGVGVWKRLFRNPPDPPWETARQGSWLSADPFGEIFGSLVQCANSQNLVLSIRWVHRPLYSTRVWTR